MQKVNIESLGNGMFLVSAKAPEAPRVKKNTSQKIMYFGEDNLFPQHVLETIDKSSYGDACRKTFAAFLYGKGYTWVKGAGKENSKFKAAVEAKIFTQGVYRKICFDYATLGAVCGSTMFNVNGKVTEIDHMDVSTFRYGMPDAGTLKVTTCKLSSNWADIKKPENQPKEFYLFDPIYASQVINKLREEGPESLRQFPGQIFYAKAYKTGKPWYGEPTWYGCINWVYVDGEIAIFQANNIDNGFFPSVIIHHKGDMEGEMPDGTPKKEALKSDLNNWQGAEDAGKIFNTFGENPPEVIQFTANTNADLFNALSSVADRKIAAGFQIAPALAGIEQAGALGNTKEIVDAVELYHSRIAPDQDFICEQINQILKSAEGYDGSLIAPTKIKPISYLDPNFLQYLDQSEIRVGIGYPEQRPSQLVNNQP